MSLWNSDAESFDLSKIRSVMTITNARINEYNEKVYLSLIGDSTVNFNQKTNEGLR